MKEMVGGCCVCADENGWTDNPLIYCDGENCDVAVHQGCYGIQEVPEGEWFCAKCSSPASSLPGGANEATFCCQLCPFDYGALKKTDRGGWAHVICALYIPEVRFGNVHSMEPVILSDVPCDKFNRTCYICSEERPGDAKKGACMSCNKSTCKRSFHVTCAQRKGLLCEEGAISRNVKYCGYCEVHLKKAINDPAIKVIPACPPVQRLPKEDKKKAKALSTTSPLKSHMLVDPLPRPDQVNSVLGLGSSANSTNSGTSDERPSSGPLQNSSIFAPPPTAFSPPLTTSSRSSVALEPTPPLGTKTSITSGPLIPSATFSSTASSSYSHMANGSSLGPSETTVGNHCLQQLQQSGNSITSVNVTQPTQVSTSVLNDLNGYPAASQLSSFMHEIPARNTTSVASLLPPGAAEYHLNGSGDEEKTVKAVLTAPLTKAKRMRDSKNDTLDKSSKRPRAHPRAPTVLGSSSTSSSGGTVGKSASMQRLINLVAPVVSETVTDFQRDRVAYRTAVESRRAVAEQSLPSTSTNGTLNASNPPSEIHMNANSLSQATNHLSSVGSLSGTSSNDPITQNGSSSTSHNSRLNLPTFMEQLLERQWDQGSTLLMGTAHFDVAQLFSCLFQLKSENFRLEENLANLRKRRDHLFTLNSRLAEVNVLDVPKKHREHNHPDASIVPKELKAESLPPTTVPLPANHSSHVVNSFLEDVKPSTKNSSAGSRKAVPNTMPAPMPISTAPVTLTSSAAPTGTLPTVTNNRATPSSGSVPSLSATPVMNTVSEMAMSPERIASQIQNLNLYRNLHVPPTDPSQIAAQLTSMINFPAGVNVNNIFSRLLSQPHVAAAVMGMNNHGALTPASVTPLPPSSATPNGT